MSIFNKVNKHTIAAFRQFLAMRGASGKSIKRKESSLKKFFSWAVEKRYIRENPFKPKFSIFHFPFSFRSYRALPYFTYINFLILLIFGAALGFGIYQQFIVKAPEKLAYPAAETRPKRYLSFQGRLTDSTNTPITEIINFQFKLYDLAGSGTPPTGGTLLWDSGSCPIDPDEDGIFAILLGTTSGTGYTCSSAPEIPSSVFSENSQVWLQITIGSETLSPRIQIATVAYALNAETLQGFPLAWTTNAEPTATMGAIARTVPALNPAGNLVIASASPKIWSTSGTFQIRGQALSIVTDTGTGGNITIAPDGTGVLNIVPTSGNQIGGTINATNSALTTGALYTGRVENDNTGFDFLRFFAGTSPVKRFSVGALGNIDMENNLDVGGAATITGTLAANGAIISNLIPSGTRNLGSSGSNWDYLYVNNIDAFTLQGAVTGNGQNINDLATLQANTIEDNDDTTLSINDNLSVIGNVVPSAGNTYDLGSTTAYWNNLYVNNIYAPGTGVSGYWQRNLGALSPTNITDDLLIGGTATASAKFQVFGTGTNAGNIYLTGTLNTVSGNLTIDSAGGTTTVSDNLVVTGTSDLRGDVSDSGGNLILADTVDIGSSTTGLRVDTSGNVIDIDGNIVLNDQTDIGSATTGIRVTTGGSISDIDGTLQLNDTVDITGTVSDSDSNLVLADIVDIGSATTGINVTAAGLITDTDGNVVIGDIVDLGSATTGINISTAGLITDTDGNVIIGDTVDLGSGTTGLRVDTSGNVIDIDGNIVLNDQTDIGSATTGIRVTTAGSISDIDGTLQLNDAVDITGTISDSDSDLTIADNLVPSATSTYNLGSSSLYWNAVYANNYYAPGTGVSGYWQRNLGTLAPTNITDDVLVGGTATSSALVRLPGINNQNAWFNLGTGNVGIGTTSPSKKLDVAGDGVFSGTLALNGASQDDNRGINLSFIDEAASVDGIYVTMNTGAGQSVTGLTNILTVDSGAWLAGIYNQVSGSGESYGYGIYNAISSSGADYTEVTGIYNYINVGGGGSSWGWGINTEASTANDASAQSVYAHDVELKTFANDQAYGLRIYDDIYGTSTGGTQYGIDIDLDDPNVTNYAIITKGGHNIFNEYGEDYDFRIEGDTDPNLFFVDASTDRVGIGTTGPNAKLDVLKTTTFNLTTPGQTTGNIHLSAVDATSITQGITFSGPASYITTAQAGIYGKVASGFGSALYFATTDDFNTGSKTRMTIDPAGSVGIGTTNPATFKLEVAGNIGPEATGTRDLGSTARVWNNIYANNYYQGSTALGLWLDAGTYIYPANVGTGFQIADTSGNLSTGGTASFCSNCSPNGAVTIDSSSYINAAKFIDTANSSYFLDPAGAASLNIAGYATMAASLAVGYSSLPSGPGNAVFSGNVGIGTTTPNNLIQVADLIDFRNADWKTLIGYQAGKYDLGQYNTYIGYQTGSADNATGKTDAADYNTGIGYRALYSNTTGNYNSAMGNYALQANTTGNSNSAMGNYALQANTTGYFNSAMGVEAGLFIADGSTANTTGDYNTFLGYNTKALADNDQNETVIGYNAIGAGSNSVVLGNNSVTKTILNGNVGIGTTGPGKLLDVAGVIRSYSGTPQIHLYETDGAVDNKIWNFRVSGETLYGYAWNDAENSAYYWLKVDRTGTTIDSVSFPSNVGIGTTAPDRKLDVLDGTYPQLRLTQADGTVYTDFQVNSSGELLINPSGGSVRAPSGWYNQGSAPTLEIGDSGYGLSSYTGILYFYGGAGGFSWRNSGRTGNLMTLNDSGDLTISGVLKGSDIGARAYRNVAQSIPNTTYTPLAFNSERFDTDNIHDTVTNNSRLTCRTAGKYLITTNVFFDLNTTGFREVWIWLNGATIIGRLDIAAADSNRALIVSTIYDLALNDYIEVRVRQDSGAALNVLYAANYSPEFMMIRIAGADIAEYYPTKDLSLEEGDIVAIDPEVNQHIRKSDKPYQKPMGIISSNPAMILGNTPDKENNRLVGLAGRVSVKVSSTNGPIKNGDSITASSFPGVGMKATKAGYTVAQALEGFNPEKLSCQEVGSLEEITWPEWIPNNGVCFKLPDDTFVGLILGFIDLSYYDPDVYLTDTGDLTITSSGNGNEAGIVTLTDALGNAITRVGAFAEIAVAQIRAGVIQTQELFAEKKIVSPLVETGIISPLPDSTDITIQIGNKNATESGFGQLLVQNEKGETVASIDSSGNATFAGTLYADEIVARKGTFGELLAATVSATQIAAADLTEIQTRLTTLETQLTGTNPVTPTPTPDLSQPEASESALLAEVQNWEISDVSQDLKITSNLKVLGRTSLASTTVAGPLSQDGSLILDQGNSINVITGTLYLQNLGFGGVDILAGKVVIDVEGNVQIAGNLAVGGEISASKLAINAKESEFGKILEIKSPTGETLASIDASGSASFASLTISADYSATQSATLAEIRTNATSGLGILPAGETEFTIFNPKVDNDTLVYITPVTSTQNKVLYVKAKKAGEWFKVGIDTTIDKEIRFNWWIIN